MKTQRDTRFFVVGADGDFFACYGADDGGFVIAGDESPYEDCDFGGEQGLVVMDGTRCEREREDQTEDSDAPHYWPYGSWDWYYPDPTWRQATAEEAAAIGLIVRAAQPGEVGK